ncbi:hypothetical protein ACFQ8O_18165, partial [Streptomyces coelicoflavus]
MDTARWTGGSAGGEDSGDGVDGGVAARPVGRAPAPLPAPDAGSEPRATARCTGRPDVPPSAVRGAGPVTPGPTAGAGAGRGEDDVGRDEARCTGGSPFAAPEADPAFVPDPDPDAGTVRSAPGEVVGAGEPVAVESGVGSLPDGGVALPSVGRAVRCTGVPGPVGVPDAGAVGPPVGEVRGEGAG